ncbi:MAG: DUF411 domain-containing protein [Deltaproteobacteria bacterium]|nr:DUF411 domain-containing protein [Deltaproteobacteria bacterium]
MIRTLQVTIIGLFVTLIIASTALAADVTMYKSPYCGCCTSWSDHLESGGFSVTSEKRGDMDTIKDRHGIPINLRSCHTAIVDGYIIEGHVPFSDVKRMLKERPDIKGLTVPGMPIGSPGMEQGDRRDSFNVLAIRKDGSTFIYNSYPGR